MAFPASPTNGQSATVNGIVYTYNSTTNGWKRSATANTAVLSVAGTSTLWGVTSVVNQTQATSTTTGALQVTGGVGIGGNLWVGGNLNIVGNITTVNYETVLYTETANVLTATVLTANVSTANVLTANVSTANIFSANITTLATNTIITSGNVWMGDTVTFNKTVDNVKPVSGSTGTVTYDLNVSNVFYETTPAANWTINYVNFPSIIDRAVVATHIISQGSTAYIPTAVQVGGSAQTIRWIGGTALSSGHASAIDVISFSIIQYSSGSYLVLGQYGYYN